MMGTIVAFILLVGCTAAIGAAFWLLVEDWRPVALVAIPALVLVALCAMHGRADAIPEWLTVYALVVVPVTARAWRRRVQE